MDVAVPLPIHVCPDSKSFDRCAERPIWTVLREAKGVVWTCVVVTRKVTEPVRCGVLDVRAPDEGMEKSSSLSELSIRVHGKM